MCGISGFINSTYQLDVNIIDHRGPDSSGMVSFENVQLGHTRLSILDLSENAAQPMESADGRYVLVFNGELYNHIDVREELVRRNYDFRSSSDTETLLNAFIEFGKDCTTMFNGIFSFAILDRHDRTLFMARDRFGVKPFYYFFKNNTFGFASEVKSLMPLTHDLTDIDENGVLNYIRYLWSPGESTVLKDVKKLLPGHSIFIDFKQPKLSLDIEKWYFSKFNGTYLYNNEEAAIDVLDDLLKSAVKRQLLSDVPVGFFLSGGLDSSLLVAMAKELIPNKKLQCFTISTSNYSMEDEGFSSDLQYAQMVAKYLDVDLEVIESESDIVNDFDHMIWHLDEPQADPSPLQVGQICKRAREMGFKVLIGGTAGDDIFSGYRRHIAYQKFQKLQVFPLQGLSKLFRKLIKPNSSMKRRLSKLFLSLSYPRKYWIYSFFEWIPYTRAKKLLNSDFQSRLIDKNKFLPFEKILADIKEEKNSLNQQLYLEQNSFLVDHNLNYTDKMGMAYGVEIRVPYLDNDLVEFAEKLNPSLKLKKDVTKYLLRKVAERYLPNDVIYRPKTGFGAPVRKWMTNDLRDFVDERLNEDKITKQGIFNNKEIKKLITDNQKSKIDASYSIWALVSFQSWYDQFLKNS